jgi:hypothetical protein
MLELAARDGIAGSGSLLAATATAIAAVTPIRSIMIVFTVTGTVPTAPGVSGRS